MKNLKCITIILFFVTVLINPSCLPAQQGQALKMGDVKNITASSFLANDPLWHHTHIIDGKVETIWVADNQQDGKEEWVQINFLKKFIVKKIGIINGNTRNQKAYAKNHQIKEMLLLFSDGTQKEISLKKNPDFQYITIDNIATDNIRFTVQSTFPGTKYPHTCISEIEIYVL